MVSCVREVSGFDHETNTVSAPSVALKLGHSLKKCAVSIVAEALQTNSKQKEEKANAFIRLCELEWCSEVSTTALSTLHNKKLNKVTIIPLTEDIAKMHDFLKQLSMKAQEILQSGTDTGADKTKSWLTLAELILFYRRRSGEVSKNFNRLSRVHEHYRQTTDRWTGDSMKTSPVLMQFML